MKNLKTVTICLVIAYIVLQYASGASYYKRVFTGDLIGNYGGIFNLLVLLVRGILNIAIVVIGMLALASADANARDRAYSLFRYIYVMAYLVGFPGSVLFMIVSAKYLSSVQTTAFMIITQHLFSIAFTVFLIICKPVKPVLRVNLQDYDMATFTTTGHRFVHYLLDSLFLTPILIGMVSMLYNASRMFYMDVIPFVILVLVFLNFFMYFFLSEVIFRQTFGKMITWSCVATNGIEFSNGRIFLRTLCRLIPFDSFSFLFGANWHDKASATAVVYVDSWENAFKDTTNSEQP